MCSDLPFLPNCTKYYYTFVFPNSMENSTGKTNLSLNISLNLARSNPDYK